jgi:hypothetical protein
LQRLAASKAAAKRKQSDTRQPDFCTHGLLSIRRRLLRSSTPAFAIRRLWAQSATRHKHPLAALNVLGGYAPLGRAAAKFTAWSSLCHFKFTDLDANGIMPKRAAPRQVDGHGAERRIA